MADVTGAASSAGLGATSGVVLNLAPEIGRWVFGAGSGAVVPAVQAAMQAATGSGDPERQVAALADPDRAAALRVSLARIAAEQAQSEVARLLAGVSGDRVVASAFNGHVAYGAPLVSIIVLLTFALVVFVALTRTMPQGAEPVLNVLLGTLGAMATSVVGYWVGSSAGSARKDERLASLAERG